MKKNTLLSALTKNKHKRRLAFEELEKEMRILDVEHQKSIKGGIGIIKSGSGTPQDPYIISQTVQIDPNGMNSDIYLATMNGLQGTMGSSTGIEYEGNYYRFEVETKIYNKYDGTPMNTGIDDSGNPYGYRDIIVSQKAGSAEGAYGQFGGNNITLYDNALSSFSNYGEHSKGKLASSTIIHELGHSMGLNDNDGTDTMQQVMVGKDPYNELTKVLLDMPGVYDAEALKKMFDAQGIIWDLDLGNVGSTGSSSDDGSTGGEVSTGF